MALVRLLMDAAGGALLPTGEGQEEARERARADARRLFMVADTDASGTLGFPESCALPGHAGLRHASQGVPQHAHEKRVAVSVAHERH